MRWRRAALCLNGMSRKVAAQPASGHPGSSAHQRRIRRPFRRAPARLAAAAAPQPARPRARAEISARHLSFVESGRASPSRDMVLRLAETLEVPLRERNALLLAAGFAPVYRHRPLDDPGMRAAWRGGR